LNLFNFNAERFLRIQSAAVGLAEPIDQIAAGMVRDPAAQLFFAGTGGAGILMQPARHYLAARSRLPCHLVQPAELVLEGHPCLDERAWVVIPSLSGTTRESIAALEYCRQRGASVLALVGHADTPLARQASHALVNFAEDDTSSESFYLQSLLLVLSLLRQRGEFPAYAEVVAELRRLPELLLRVKQAFEPQAERLAERMRDEGWHIITAAGAAWPQAFYYGMCILEEMQWIRTRPVHAADFFHGTLELLEAGVSLIIFKGEDAQRPLADRVEAFARQVTDRIEVLDAAAFELPQISARTRALISPIVLATALERLSTHLEAVRGHPLTLRRYYKRIAY
jgi:fructoselysine-6-phosphate deglycase